MTTGPDDVPPLEFIEPVELVEGSPDDVDEPPAHWQIDAHADEPDTTGEA